MTNQAHAPIYAAPQVPILATSRERIDLLGETVLLLDGLDVPEETTAVTDVIRPSAKMDMAVIHDYIMILLGVTLFLKGEFGESKNLIDAVSEGARRIHNGTTLTTLLATLRADD